MEIYKEAEKSEFKSIGSTLAIGFYNLGIEYEKMGCYKEAYYTCLQGIGMCKQLLGTDHPLYIRLNEFLKTREQYKEIKENMMKGRPSARWQYGTPLKRRESILNKYKSSNNFTLPEIKSPNDYTAKLLKTIKNEIKMGRNKKNSLPTVVARESASNYLVLLT